MGDTTAPKLKRQSKPADSDTGDTATVHAALDPLKTVYIYEDELQTVAEDEIKKGVGGTVTLVTESGKKVTGILQFNYFTVGTWDVKFGPVADGNAVLTELIPVFPPNTPRETIDQILSKDAPLSFLVEKDKLAKANRLWIGAQGRFIRYIVSYTRKAGGNVQNVGEVLPLTGGDHSPLKDPALAKLYLQFVEHFGGINVDLNIAVDGLTEDEVQQVEQGRTNIIAITDRFLQGFAEFSVAKNAATPPPTLEEFSAMEEAIFFQTKVKNDLARRNMLAISIGSLLFTKDDGSKGVRKDIGIIRRDDKNAAKMLLYDRFGNPVRGIIGGYVDSEFRSTDLEKVNRDLGIPTLDITVSDRALYLFLRSLEQNLGHSIREVEALVASYYKFSVFINAEIHRRYNGEIRERFIACAPVVIGFFVAHAFVAFLVRARPEVGVPLMLLLKGAGMVLGFDAVLLDMSLMAQAGRHFTQMEQLHRENGQGKPELTKLSSAHLAAGAAALLDAAADLLVLGVLFVGPIVAVKVGPVIVKGIRNAARARVKVTVQDGVAVKIEPTNPKTEITTAEPKIAPDAKTLGTKPPTSEPAPLPDAAKPIETPNAYKGEPVKGSQPTMRPLEVKKPKGLEQTPDDFIKNSPEQKSVQQELFDKAKQASVRQDLFIKNFLVKKGFTGATSKSILKRSSVSEFTTKLFEKARKNRRVKTIGQIKDIVRGRIDVENPADVPKIAEALKNQKEIQVKDFYQPFEVAGVKNGYPRFHVNLIDPQTGIIHEWQIGTKQMTAVFENNGIKPSAMEIPPEKTNLHDIDYKFLKEIDEPSSNRTQQEKIDFKKLAEKANIHEFRQRVANMSAELTQKNFAESEFNSKLESLHNEASNILKVLFEEKGPGFYKEIAGE